MFLNACKVQGEPKRRLFGKEIVQLCPSVLVEKMVRKMCSVCNKTYPLRKAYAVCVVSFNFLSLDLLGYILGR